MSRVAAVDCGTNSIRLLVADVTGDGTLVDVDRRLEVVRLGQGVDRTGRLDPAAIERTRVALAGYAAAVRELGAERVRMVATSATRDAANRDEFTAMVVATLGVPPEVITGEEEAALSFAGAVHNLRGSGEPAPYLVVDIGGGSTELVLGTAGVEAAYSMDVGCVRLTERHLAGDPPSAAEVAAAVRDVRAALAAARAVVPVERARTVVGVAGTVTTVAAVALGHPRYDSALLERSRVPAARVGEVTERLLGMPRAERAVLPVMHPGRVDVIGAGAVVLREVLAAVGAAEVVVSEHDILDGVALALAAGADTW